MRAAAHVRPLVWNEARALLPAFVAAVLAAGVAALTRGDIRQFSRFAFGAATIALGAQAIGHEYAHRTLTLMLTLPVDRRRLFLVKLAVVSAMVAALAACASLLGLFPDVPALPPWLIAGVALCLAPALTMLCRSQVAGAIFSMSVPWVVLIGVMMVNGTGFGRVEAGDATLAAWSRLMVLVLAGGAVLGWTLFMRLEAIEGGTTGIHVTWRTRTPQHAAPSRPLWQLVKKEFRLQQTSFAVTALYLGACAAAAVLGTPGPERDVSFAAAATVVYSLGLPALVGSLATAQERQLGTLAWQLQLPAPTWQQWGTKAATVFGLALLLSVGLPVLLAPALRPIERPLVEMPVVLAIAMTAVSMYVSSLCDSAVRAIVASVVAASFVLWLVLELELWSTQHVGWPVLLSGVIVLLVGFAFVNHRPEPPALSRIWRQVLSLAALLGVGLLVARNV